jgi:hypothetical protein
MVPELYLNDVVVEYGRDVLRGELVYGVELQQTRLPDAYIQRVMTVQFLIIFYENAS